MTTSNPPSRTIPPSPAIPGTTPGTIPGTLSRKQYYLVLIVPAILIVLFLGFYNLETFPKTWFDEGSHLHVPKALIKFGVYADYSSEGFRHYGPTIGVGPTVMLPIAAVFEFFGIGLLQARMVMVAYLFGTLVLYFLLARHLTNLPVALVTTALFVTSPVLSSIEYGRQVLGEVPALFFMLAAFLLWFSRWKRADFGSMVLVGVLFGLSVITKYQFLLALGATLLIAWFASLVSPQQRKMQARYLIPGIVTALIFGLWQVVTLAYLGPSTMAENFASLREFTAGAAATFSPELMARSLGQLIRPGAFFGLLPVAFIYFGYRLYARASDTSYVASDQEKRQQLAILFLLIVANLLWYVVGSVSWIRYGFVGLAFSCLFVAGFFYDATGGFQFIAQPVFRNADNRLVLFRQLLMTVIIAAMIAVPGARLIAQVAESTVDDSTLMARYLQEQIATDALIETWEPQMGFLTDHNYHYPPQLLLNRAVRQVWLKETPVAELYNFEEYSPQFVLVGEFSKWINVYPVERLENQYELITTVGQYDLYGRETSASH